MTRQGVIYLMTPPAHCMASSALERPPCTIITWNCKLACISDVTLRV